MHRSKSLALVVVTSALMFCSFVMGAKHARSSHGSVLPIVNLKSSELNQVPVCVVNDSDGPVEVALDQAGLRNVDVRVERDGKVVGELEAVRTDISTIPRRSIVPGGRLPAKLNLIERFGAKQLSPGIYIVTLKIRPLGETAKPSDMRSSEFVLSVIDDATR